MRTKYETKEMITCIADTECINAATVSAANWLTRTGKIKYFPQNYRYIHTVYADNFQRKVKRQYGLLDSLNVELCNSPDTGLDEITQYSRSYHIRSVYQLQKNK